MTVKGEKGANPRVSQKKFGFSVLVHFSRNGSSLSLCLSLALSASFESHCMCCAYADRWRKEEEKEFDTKGTKKKYRKQATYTPWLFNAGKELSIIPPENSSSSLFGLVERSRERTWGRVNKRKATICWRKKEKKKKKKKKIFSFSSISIVWINKLMADKTKKQKKKNAQLYPDAIRRCSFIASTSTFE